MASPNIYPVSRTRFQSNSTQLLWPRPIFTLFPGRGSSQTAHSFCGLAQYLPCFQDEVPPGPGEFKQHTASVASPNIYPVSRTRFQSNSTQLLWPLAIYALFPGRGSSQTDSALSCFTSCTDAISSDPFKHHPLPLKGTFINTTVSLFLRSYSVV